MDHASVVVNGFSEDSIDESKSRHKWPFSFWALLKVLCLFHHRTVVTERKCFLCHVKNISQNNHALENITSAKKYGIIDALKLAYESDGKKIGCGETESLLAKTCNDNECEVCKSEWWNLSRTPYIYTEEEIGVDRWNHRGSSVISIVVLVLLLGLWIWDMSYPFIKLWSSPGHTMELLTEIGLFLFVVSNVVVVLCSKLRSIFMEGCPFLFWASALNVRYIIKRAQFLDLHNKGLPGKLLLAICICWPMFNSCFRAAIFLITTDYNDSVAFFHAVRTSIVCTLLFQCWGCFVYMLYLIRVSFQRQFTLVLSYFVEYEGCIDACRGILLNVVTDFQCFKQLSNLYVVIMLPVAFIGMAANLSWSYLLDQACRENEEVMIVLNCVLFLAWSEMIMGIFLVSYAQGGVDVMYLWDNFFDDVLKVHSDRHEAFWRNLIRSMALISRKEGRLLVASVVFSVIGVYMALSRGNQDISFLVKACNGTNLTSTIS
ncbi:hypothetical protein HOLleu_18062 [Holothuria leucospilota]|uniref:Uncharacterized protein n=1 Tax=Holothuria leucospilota TaxID=206669 RepID=A0A9Q1C2P4_HOLLE|nr:hypothetical protein HOLleu_18062 [Holothuria leucospilota]